MDPHSATATRATDQDRAHELQAFVACALRLQGLDLSLGDRDAILAAAAANAAAHALIESFPITDEMETAAIFEA